MPPRRDKELEEYRNLLETPKEFRDGFGWTTIAGIFFCGLIMLPGSIYLSLMTGGSLGAAATWVTVILFSEISRRALKAMEKQELVVLLHAANVMIAANVMFPGGPFGHFIFRAYLVTSEAVRDAGMMNAFPEWFVPKPDSDAILQRNLLHPDWLQPIGLAFFMTIVGVMKKYTLGYFFFRVTSDVENLPFPLAPIRAQGAMALAEADEKEEEPEKQAEEQVEGKESIAETERMTPKKKKSEKWRLFSLGATMGIAFGFFKVGIPAISGLVLEKPFFLIPQPFIDTTTLTETVLPATPTGMTLDLGIILLGFVLPFWAVLGTFIAVASTLIINPVLHHLGFLQQWQPGMNAINTTFANRIDFWLSFSVGAAFGLAAVSIFQTIRDVRRKMSDLKEKRREAQQDEEERESLWRTPVEKGRGDYPIWMALVGYTVASLAVIFLCYHLVRGQVHIAFFFLFSFVYNPLISYVNARLLGIAGQQVQFPFVRETAFVLSGAKGIEIWVAPIPIENFGGMAQSFRVNELTGVNFRSLLKADLCAIPVLFILSFLFWAFVWHSEDIPSEVFPYAQVKWELQAKTQVLYFSSTFVPEGEDPATKSILDSQFMQAVHPSVIAGGFGFTVVVFALLSTLGLPVMLIYGFVRGLGQMPHFMALEIVGALLGRYYFRKKFGTKNFLRMAPTIMAGYFTGVGLISMATIAMKLIKEAVSSTPF